MIRYVLMESPISPAAQKSADVPVLRDDPLDLRRKDPMRRR